MTTFSCIPARVSLAFLVASGLMIIYISRTVLSVAILAMVKVIDATDGKEIEEAYCLRIQNELQFANGTINNNTDYNTFLNFSEVANTSSSANHYPDEWKVMELTTTQRGFVLGSFFYGYLSTAIIGGTLADKFGTKRVFGYSVLIEATANFLVPVAAKTSYILLILLRFFIGMAEGSCYPSIQSLISIWVPLEDRSFFVSFTFVANSFGIILTMSVAGLIIESLGWESVFYITGAIMYAWLIFWTMLMYDNPEDHPRISDKEKQKIAQSIASAARKNKPESVPWCAMLKSIPLWAITITHSANMFGLHLLITQLPIFLNSVMGLSIRQNAALSTAPFFARYVGSNLCGSFDTYLLRKKYFKIEYHRKFFNTFGFYGAAILLLVVAYIGCRPYVSMALFTTALFISGGYISGYSVNWADVAPNFGGTALGISNTVAFGFTTLAPIMVGVLTPNETLPQWQRVFWLNAIIYFLGGTAFLILSSTENQPWNFIDGINPTVKNNDKELEMTTEGKNSSDNDKS